MDQRHPVNDEMRVTINVELDRIEKKYGVKIIYACESGSRGWGFASTNSDYDVRFIYVNHPSHYVRVDNEARDTIEEMVSKELDLAGWSITKTLQLAYKSNPTLLEWLNSPIVYRKVDRDYKLIRDAALKHFIPESSYMHYISMAKQNKMRWLSDEKVRMKKYFYSLRPLLAAMWVRESLEHPPMVFHDLLPLLTDPILYKRIQELVNDKVGATEQDLIDRCPILDQFIDFQLSREKPDFGKYERPDIYALTDLAWHFVDQYKIDTFAKLQGIERRKY
ncbi:nucleotidyltransferase [Pseudomonas phage 9Ps-7B]|nr:nucleotidyltransferase [Pseudomonas phage 6B]WRQ06076.1 nucleotidyltransferase [Pseudomonas phage 9-Ps-8B]WRQ06484.1 nucleotidyltransferase [Pseudomonas phage 9Ps-7B]WRQ06835.1 nucleotidyltransferase [Pseudomonas phage 14Ps5-6]